MSNAIEMAFTAAAEMAFAAVCRDLAQMALQRQPDPVRAVPVFLGLTGSRGFKAALTEFLGEVARDMPRHAEPKPAGDEGHSETDAQASHAPPPAGPKASGEGHSEDDAQKAAAPPGAGGEGHETGDAHSVAAPPPVTSTSRRAALTAARMRDVRALSGVKIHERNGQRTEIEFITVGRAHALLHHLAQQAGERAVEWMVMRLMVDRLPGVYQPDTPFIDIYDAAATAAIVADARAGADALRDAALALSSRPRPAMVEERS